VIGLLNAIVLKRGIFVRPVKVSGLLVRTPPGGLPLRRSGLGLGWGVRKGLKNWEKKCKSEDEDD